MSEFKFITAEKNEFMPGEYNISGDIKLETVYQLKRIADELAKKNDQGVI